MLHPPYLYNSELRERCVLCANELEGKKKVRKRDTLVKTAKEWKTLDLWLCSLFPYNEFLNVDERLKLESSKEKFTVHEQCGITFRTHLKRQQLKGTKLPPIPEST